MMVPQPRFVSRLEHMTARHAGYLSRLAITILREGLLGQLGLWVQSGQLDPEDLGCLERQLGPESPEGQRGLQLLEQHRPTL